MEEYKKICNSDKKVVFFDIDETLYTPKIGIPESAVYAIKQLRKNGHKAFICTGRARSMIFASMTDIGFDGIIAGAGTYVEYNGEILFRQNMEYHEIKNVVKKLREYNFMPVPEGHDYLYYEDESKWTEEYEAIYNKYSRHIAGAMKKIPDDEGDMCISKMSAIFTKESMLDEAEKYFSDKYTVVNHHNYLLELIPKGLSKAEGINKLISKLNISRENTCAFGDSMNDYEMLSFVNDSVAMGNSDERILKLAKYVTESLENDGIYKGLKKLGLI